MRIGVITFPGSNCDRDCVHFFTQELKQNAKLHWYQNSLESKQYDLVIVPGGFSYGDYLRAGAIAARCSIMEDLRKFVAKGGWVLGICNGFQILTEAQLLPGALTWNSFKHFLCTTVTVTAQESTSPWMPRGLRGQSFQFPVANAQGRFVADAETLRRLNENGQILWRYQNDFNGSEERIAGVTDTTGRVCGMMPHPERLSSEGARWLTEWISSVGTEGAS